MVELPPIRRNRGFESRAYLGNDLKKKTSNAWSEDTERHSNKREDNCAVQGDKEKSACPMSEAMLGAEPEREQGRQVRTGNPAEQAEEEGDKVDSGKCEEDLAETVCAYQECDRERPDGEWRSEDGA